MQEYCLLEKANIMRRENKFSEMVKESGSRHYFDPVVRYDGKRVKY